MPRNNSEEERLTEDEIAPESSDFAVYRVVRIPRK